MKLTIIDIAYHRNGICGAPFATVLFEDSGPEASRKIAILFEAAIPLCRRLDVATSEHVSSNRWRHRPLTASDIEDRYPTGRALECCNVRRPSSSGCEMPKPSKAEEA